MDIILKLKVMKIIILFAHCLLMIRVLKNTISCLLVTLNVKVKKQWLLIMMVQQRKKLYLKLIYLKQDITVQKLLQMIAYFL